MSACHWHKRYHSDALTGFMSLTLEERGAYQTVLDLIYDRGGPIVDNDRLLAGYMGVSLRKWAALRDSLLAKRKITRADGYISNSRAISELEKSTKTSRKHSENGMKGGRKSAEVRKNANEISEDGQASVEPGSSLSRYQIPEEANASSTRVRDGSEIVDLTDRLAKAAGVPIPDFGHAVKFQQIVQAWLDAGADPALAMETVTSRAASSRTQPRTLLWFDGAVRDAISARNLRMSSASAHIMKMVNEINARPPIPERIEQ